MNWALQTMSKAWNQRWTLFHPTLQRLSSVLKSVTLKMFSVGKLPNPYFFVCSTGISTPFLVASITPDVVVTLWSGADSDRFHRFPCIGQVSKSKINSSNFSKYCREGRQLQKNGNFQPVSGQNVICLYSHDMLYSYMNTKDEMPQSNHLLGFTCCSSPVGTPLENAS